MAKTKDQRRAWRWLTSDYFAWPAAVAYGGVFMVALGNAVFQYVVWREPYTKVDDLAVVLSAFTFVVVCVQLLLTFRQNQLASDRFEIVRKHTDSSSPPPP